MNTTVLEPAEQSFTHSNCESTVFDFCDVTAIAELLFDCATITTAHGPKPKTVTIADVIEAMERQLHAEAVHSVAFENTFVGEDGSGMRVADRHEVVARACEHLVSCGLLRCGTKNKTCTSNFWETPEHDIALRITPSWELIVLMHDHAS